MNRVILKIVVNIERLFNGVIAFAYKDKVRKDADVYYVCVNDYTLYISDSRFVKLKNAWRKMAISNGLCVVFCYCEPSEKKLSLLAEEENLIINC